mmetsp:Transcript_51290/g.62734  ORF Transcript_51290/g.62734 Transcript_51290/m.62734 type:complete len:144 (-) Transcript_51290:572-1003(-)
MLVVVGVVVVGVVVLAGVVVVVVVRFGSRPGVVVLVVVVVAAVVVVLVVVVLVVLVVLVVGGKQPEQSTVPLAMSGTQQNSPGQVFSPQGFADVAFSQGEGQVVPVQKHSAMSSKVTSMFIQASWPVQLISKQPPLATCTSAI